MLDNEFYARGKVNNRIYVRVLLQLFCSIQQKEHHYPLPLQLPEQNVT